MANVTDPLVNQLSGSDPQNLMEYITRSRIYESRYWKEECFGLTVSDVLEKATALRCIGNLPCHCLKLTLKLLQLHPEHELIAKAFVEQDEFKYVRALGLLYIRLTSRPVEIYNSLEACYADFRKLRLWRSSSQMWDIITMDDFVHQLLHMPSNNFLGIALPRLPARRILQDAGYLPEGPRPTVLQDVLADFAEGDKNKNDSDRNYAYNPLLAYLMHKAIVEQCPSAIVAWERRQKHLQQQPTSTSDSEIKVKKESVSVAKKGRVLEDTEVEDDRDTIDREKKKSKKKRKDESGRNYGGLFKNPGKSSKGTTTTLLRAEQYTPKDSADPTEEDSEEYWNQERAKLGLSRLK